MQEQIDVLKDMPDIKELFALSAPILHGLIALWGLLDCFFGLKIFMGTVRILMAFVGATVGATLAMHFWPGSVGALLGAAGVGLLAGILIGWYVWKMGLVLMAVMAGFMFATPFAQALSTNYALILPLGAAVLAGVFVFLMLEPAVICSTAMTGAFRMVYGAAFFMGGASLLDYVGGEKNVEDLLLGGDWRLAVGTLAAAALGAFVQFHFWRKSRPAPSREE